MKLLFWLLDIIKDKCKCLISKYLPKELLEVCKEKDLYLQKRKKQQLSINVVMLQYHGFYKELILYLKLQSFQDLKVLWVLHNILSTKINYKQKTNYQIEYALFQEVDVQNFIFLNKLQQEHMMTLKKHITQLIKLLLNLVCNNRLVILVSHKFIILSHMVRKYKVELTNKFKKLFTNVLIKLKP